MVLEDLIFLCLTIYGKLAVLYMESQYYRTFIGLPLRQEQGTLEARLDLMAALEGERISWVKPENFHVTLRFIGETKLSDVKGIGNALRAGVHIPEKILQESSLLGSFGPRKKPRVIWVGFEQSSFFSLLKSDVDRVLEGCGIPVIDQAFTAHLTLGRIRSLQNLPRFYNTMDEMRKRFQSKVLFDRLVFYQSILGPHGPEYQVLEELLFS
jgi:RNA 2',3'-cyclic 3'-phosphodiesterase